MCVLRFACGCSLLMLMASAGLSPSSPSPRHTALCPPHPCMCYSLAGGSPALPLSRTLPQATPWGVSLRAYPDHAVCGHHREDAARRRPQGPHHYRGPGMEDTAMTRVGGPRLAHDIGGRVEDAARTRLLSHCESFSAHCRSPIRLQTHALIFLFLTSLVAAVA